METESPVIGFIGLGTMGTPMASRLLDAGFDVWVWNRSADKCDDLSDLGAEIASSPAELADECDVIMLCVTDAAAVESVVFGPEGIAETACDDHLIIDFSSIAPGATRRLAARLEADTGAGWIDAPVSGGVPGAEQGTLTILAGGSVDDIDQVRPLLEPLCARLTRMGDVGAGQVAKLCNQMIVGVNMLVITEMIAMAERAGVDAERLPQALAGGFADSIPLQLFGPNMAIREHEPVLAKLGLLLKDLDNATLHSRAVGAAVPMTALASQLLQQHIGRGDPDADWTTLIDLYSD